MKSEVNPGDYEVSALPYGVDRAVNKASTPRVAYAYTNGAANHARRTSITYPDDTTIDFNNGVHRKS